MDDAWISLLDFENPVEAEVSKAVRSMIDFEPELPISLGHTVIAF